MLLHRFWIFVRLVLTGGGTGGHVYPALAIAQACGRDADLSPLNASFVGTKSGLEARIVPATGLPIDFVCAAPLKRRGFRALIWTIGTNVVGFVQSLWLLHRLRPDVLIATGGYVAFPVVAALRSVRAFGMTRARIALLEPNAAAGLTNRLLAPLADEVWYAYASQARPAAAVVTGMPVRNSLRTPMAPQAARLALGLEPDATTVVVMGGSQGAQSLNDAVAALIEAGAPAGWQIAVIAGTRDFDSLAHRLGRYRRVVVWAYLDDPRAAYAAADIMVVRSGASTLGELAATATPAILVPYPHATADHQMRNARAYAARGAAVVLPDAEMSAARLRAELTAALAPERLDVLRAAARSAALEDPAATIAARVKALVSANGRLP